MLSPKFPFLDNQLILSSDRIVLHTKSDGIFLFGKGAVSLSSPQTINLDSNEKVLINSPKIELGYRAEIIGEPVVLGKAYRRQIASLITVLQQVGSLLRQVDGQDNQIQASFSNIKKAADVLLENCNNLMLTVDSPANPALSRNTYSR